MDHFVISAKPYPYDAIPNKIAVNSISSPLSSNPYINVLGSSFLNIKNVYLSASNTNIFPNGINYYNPFSNIKNLSADNPPFNAVLVTDFIVHDSKYITLQSPEYFNDNGFIDVIVENEAGYGLLTKCSVVPPLTSISNPIEHQKPTVNGIEIIKKL